MKIAFSGRALLCPLVLPTKTLRVMRWTTAFIFLFCMHASATGFSQKITISKKEISLSQLFKEIRKQTGYTFWYEDKLLEGTGKVDVEFNAATVEQVLDKVLQQFPLSYSVVDKSIIVRKKKLPVISPPSRLIMDSTVLVGGMVVDGKTGQRISGASIIVKGTKTGASSDANGRFSIRAEKGQTIVISYIGYEDYTFKVKEQGSTLVQMKVAAASMKDVVVMGVMNRPKQSFTGAATSFTKEELTRASATNVFNALRSLDPSFQLPDNLQTGSDPNAKQNILIRGGNSLGDLNGANNSDVFNYTKSPNTPLFILDGFEVSQQRISDLDINRIAGVTILKDASATAIYGSRAANGVVVVETIRPKEGKLRVTYTGSVVSEIPDLKGYDLLNAEEKIILEKDGGLYNANGVAFIQEERDMIYSYRKALVAKGNNTDWKRIPVRNGVSYNNNLFIEGGNDAVTYGLTGIYNKTAGVMKGSGRENISGNSFLSYRYRNLLFRNDFTVNHTTAINSPYGNFSSYTLYNPYHSPYTPDGQIAYYLEDIHHVTGKVLSQLTNPLYNLQLHTVDENRSLNIINNLFVQWQVQPWLRLSGRLAYNRTNNEADYFLPAKHTSFDTIPVDRFFERGSYTKTYGRNNTLDGSLNADFNKAVGGGILFASLGTTFRQEKFSTEAFRLIGFSNDRLDNILQGSFPRNGEKPTGFEGFNRLLGYFANLSYAWNQRYLFDFSYRLDGSSQFGSDKRFAPFWSVGTGWNLHNENFLKASKHINQLKLRYSYGYTGSSNFASYLALSTSQYYSNHDYLYTVGTYLLGFGNSSLRWQQTLKQNLGADITLFNKLQASVDVFHEKTKGSVISVTTAPSTGFGMYMDNMGDVLSRGIEARLNYNIFTNAKNRDNWSVFLTGMHVTSKVERISNTLEALNKRNTEGLSTAPLPRYAEGRSITALWAVPSLGIDPSTGKEIYLKRDGSKTYVYDPLDQVIVGDNRPKLQGTFGTNLEIHGIGLNLFFEYRFGGQAYNQTLVDRVENASISSNVDRRVYEERWRKPGDHTFYKGIVSVDGIRESGISYNSSRFIQDDNWVSLRNASLYYRFSNKLNKQIGLQDTKITLFSSQLFWLSSIKQERGLDYPFARSITLQVNTTF